MARVRFPLRARTASDRGVADPGRLTQDKVKSDHDEDDEDEEGKEAL